jgi:hypothetical protein
MTEDDNNKNLNEEYDDTKDLTESLSDRRILIEIRHAVTALVERVTALEHRTNPLPTNYDVRFTALESAVQKINIELRGIREDLEREREHRFTIEDRLGALESRPSGTLSKQ